MLRQRSGTHAMTMVVAERRVRYAPEDLLKLTDGGEYELVDGELVSHDMSPLSSTVTVQLEYLLRAFLRDRRLGWAFGPECGYQCFPDDPQ